MAKKKNPGVGHWVARAQEHPPGGEMAIGIYNTVTGVFKWHEGVGESLEDHCDESGDDYDELYSIYMREAEDWAMTHNRDGL